MYVVRVLENEEFNKLPYKHAKTALGLADKKKNTAYVRSTGCQGFDMFTIQHEIEELTKKISPHEEDGIRYKKGQETYTTPAGKSYEGYQPSGSAAASGAGEGSLLPGGLFDIFDQIIGTTPGGAGAIMQQLYRSPYTSMMFGPLSPMMWNVGSTGKGEHLVPRGMGGDIGAGGYQIVDDWGFPIRDVGGPSAKEKAMMGGTGEGGSPYAMGGTGQGDISPTAMAGAPRPPAPLTPGQASAGGYYSSQAQPGEEGYVPQYPGEGMDPWTRAYLEQQAYWQNMGYGMGGKPEMPMTPEQSSTGGYYYSGKQGPQEVPPIFPGTGWYQQANPWLPAGPSPMAPGVSFGGAPMSIRQNINPMTTMGGRNIVGGTTRRKYSGMGTRK